nr:MAG TPA: hypothetical protein [Caudoviricetes sp.]
MRKKYKGIGITIISMVLYMFIVMRIFWELLI